MNFEKFIQFYLNNKGGVIGAVIGIVFAILVLTINLWRTIFIAIFAIIGYYIGASIFSGNSLLKAILDRFIPPGKIR